MESIWNPERLIEARSAKEMQVKDAADRLNITPEYLSMLENGKKQPSQKLILEMCDLYSRSAGFFLHNEHQIT